MAKSAGDGSRYEIAGAAGSAAGPVLVLVHGLGLNRGMWRGQVPALAAAGYRVVTYDLYGQGESPPPPEPPSLGLFAGQLRGLLDELGLERVGLFGFSLGGMIARRFAMDHPDRLWALGILHSAHSRDAAAQAAIRKRVEQAGREGPAATVEAALERWFSDPFRRAHPEVLEQVRAWVLANDPSIYPSLYGVLAEGVTELVAPRPAIACPTLVVTGDQDYGNSPEMAAAIAAEIPGALTRILPGLRHLAMMEAPGPFNQELLAFLQGLAPGD